MQPTNTSDTLETAFRNADRAADWLIKLSKVQRLLGAASPSFDRAFRLATAVFVAKIEKYTEALDAYSRDENRGNK